MFCMSFGHMHLSSSYPPSSVNCTRPSLYLGKRSICAFLTGLTESVSGNKTAQYLARHSPVGHQMRHKQVRQKRRCGERRRRTDVEAALNHMPRGARSCIFLLPPSRRKGVRIPMPRPRENEKSINCGRHAWSRSNQ